MKLRLFLLVLALLPALHADVAADEPAIRAVLAAQVSAWNRGDIDGFMQGYWHSDDLRFASGGTITHGWQTTLERYRARYPDRQTMGTLAFAIADVRCLAPDAAVVFGRWELVRAKDRPWGLFTLVLRRFPEGWRVTADHTSSGG